MRRWLYTVLTLVILVGFAAVKVNAKPVIDQGKDLALKLDRRDEGFGSSRSKMTMVIRTRNGDSTSRKLDVSVLERPGLGDLSLMTFDFPADIRGTSLLTHPKLESADDQWLFLPSINRVKRISSRNRSGAFVSSEFAFEDLSDTHVDDFTYRHLGQEECSISVDVNGKDSIQSSTCDKLERTPVDKHSGYSKQHLLIDNEKLRVVEIEYYDVRGKLLKKLTTERFSLFEGQYWRPLIVTMENVQTGKSTVLSYESLDFGAELDAKDFARSKLGR